MLCCQFCIVTGSRMLGLEEANVNIRGGAIAIRHPLGASLQH
jgi:acetyl-CoA acetyltransferase